MPIDAQTVRPGDEDEISLPQRDGGLAGSGQPLPPPSPDSIADHSTAVGPVRLDLLEGFELIVSGAAVDVPLSAQRLLAFLALQERPVLRTYVAGSLWMDKNDERAAANLRAALWRLRQPGRMLAESSGSHLRLAPGVSVDVREALDTARRVIDREAGAADDEYDAFLLGGDILPDWYEDWVAIERERLRQLRLHALEALCMRLVERGRVAEAVDVGLAAIAAEPLRESAHRALIVAHLAEGNQAEAIRQYESYCTLLWNELGVRPSPHLEAVMTGVRHRPVTEDGSVLLAGAGQR